MRIVNCELWIGVVQSVAFANCFRLYGDFTSSFAFDCVRWYGKNGTKSIHWSGCKVFSIQTYLLRITVRCLWEFGTENVSIKRANIFVSFFRLEFFFFLLYFVLSISPFHVGFYNFHKILTIFSICIYLRNYYCDRELILHIGLNIEHWFSYLFCLFHWTKIRF